MLDRPHIAQLLPEEIATRMAERGTPIRDGEARRALAHHVSPRAAAGRRSHPLARRVRDALDDLFDTRPLEIIERVTDPDDGFVKYLFRHPDGATTEAVRIPLHKPNRFSVCLSSQVGCAMGCSFCATGRLGWGRHLEAWEMVEAFREVRDEAPGAVTGAVFMGQGEPLHNYDAVMRAARVLSLPCGGALPAKGISISTVGLVPEIRRFARERQPYRLLVSLTSAVDARREQLLPVAARWSVAEVADALGELCDATGERVSVAWVLLAGVNTGDDEVDALQHHLGDLPLRLSLIDVNDPRPNGFRPPDEAERDRFRDRLRRLGVPVVRRYSGGANEQAACGMLASTQRLAVVGGAG